MVRLFNVPSLDHHHHHPLLGFAPSAAMVANHQQPQALDSGDTTAADDEQQVLAQLEGEHSPDSNNPSHDQPGNLNLLIDAAAAPQQNHGGDALNNTNGGVSNADMGSLHSLLAASQQMATAQMAASHWADSDGNKRKRGDTPSGDDPRAKIQRTQSHQLSPPTNGTPTTHQYPPLPLMTTVTCLHAAVAQKSYGSEKRFLCPPPVVRVDCPISQQLVRFRAHQLAMRILPEHGTIDRDAAANPPPEQKATLDDNMQTSFKYLHVGGTAKSKAFHLALDIAEPAVFDPAPSSDPASAPQRLIKPARGWASFTSAPVTIISKPSKKTAKTRNLSSCILAGGPVSLFNRINSQTVRTKYMTVDQGRLCASNSTWSAFNVEVVHQAIPDPDNPSHNMPTEMNPHPAFHHPGSNLQPQPVTYGSTLLLTDSQTGLTSDPLIIRKVDKGRIVMDEGTMGGPVSQMQKVALCRITDTGARYYLSAAGPLQIVPDPSGPTAVDGKNHVVATHPLVYQPPAVRQELKNDVQVEVDEVDDFLCWTIVGISKFQYTFFDGLHNASIPQFPITPFPTLLHAPIYKPPTHTLELVLSNYLYIDPRPEMGAAGGLPIPLEVYLGSMGPLPARVYQNATLLCTTGPMGTNPANAALPAPPQGQGPQEMTPEQQMMLGGFRHPPPPEPSSPFVGFNLPPTPMMQTMVVVEMPPVQQVLQLIESLTASAAGPGGYGYMSGVAGPSGSVSAQPEQQENTNGYSQTGIVEDSSAPPNGVMHQSTEAALSMANGKGKGREPAASQPQSQQATDVSIPPPSHVLVHPHGGMSTITRGVPILFVRPSDGIGYHSGREIACENVLAGMGAAAVGHVVGGYHGWTLRVL